MNEFSILDVAAAGMGVQRGLLDLAARNVAAAQVAGPDGSFERLVPRFALRPLEQASGALDAAALANAEGDEAAYDDGGGIVNVDGGAVVHLAGAVSVRGAEADAISEMVAVLDAQRAYEANASVFEAGKRLAERTIDLGRL